MALEDILPTDLTESNVRILVERLYEGTFSRDSSLDFKSRSFKPAKNLIETYELVRKVIVDLEDRGNLPTENRVMFTEEEPDKKLIEQLNKDKRRAVVSFSLIRRSPGAFSQGAPFEGNVKNLRPILREESNDTENPGFRLATVGYWHDNLVRFTCWAQTNKTANEIAQWFEDLMDEYSWFYKAEGVDRMIFWGRGQDITKDVDGNKWYGRPIDYFVRTEKIKVFREKTLQEIILKVVTKQE